MLIGGLLAVQLVATGAIYLPLVLEPAATLPGFLTIAMQPLLLPASFLVHSAGRLTRHRFFTP